MTITSSTVTQAPVGTYRIDPATSSIAFTTKHMFGTGTVKGSFTHVAGEIVVTEDRSHSKVAATALADSFTTGTPKRDDKVKSPTFLDPANHPHLTFASSALTQTPQGWVLRGDLTVAGGTAPLELLVTELDPTTTGVAVKATGTVDRYAHGLTAMKGMTGRRLTLDLDVHATLV